MGWKSVKIRMIEEARQGLKESAKCVARRDRWLTYRDTLRPTTSLESPKPVTSVEQPPGQDMQWPSTNQEITQQTYKLVSDKRCHESPQQKTQIKTMTKLVISILNIIVSLDLTFPFTLDLLMPIILHFILR